MQCDYSELDSFVIYICVGGAAKLIDNNGETLNIRAGETVLVPASVTGVQLIPESGAKLMEVFV
jgi:mannose-6-phosphate isomerase